MVKEGKIRAFSRPKRYPRLLTKGPRRITKRGCTEQQSPGASWAGLMGWSQFENTKASEIRPAAGGASHPRETKNRARDVTTTQGTGESARTPRIIAGLPQTGR